jgi:hypothetical protein
VDSQRHALDHVLDQRLPSGMVSLASTVKNAEMHLHGVVHPVKLEHMFDPQEIGERLLDTVAGLDPAALDGAAAVGLVDAFDRIERLAAAGKAIAAAGVEASDVWRNNGSRDAIGFLAARTNTPRARVRDGLSVIAVLGSTPLLDHAFRGGALTIDQAADIAAAVTEHPESEPELVALAATTSARQLKARCVEILAEGEGAEQQHRRARAERSASSSVGRDGIWRLSVRLPIIDGAYVDKALDLLQTQIFDDPRTNGELEPFDAYRADAVVALARAAMGEHCTGTCANQPADDEDPEPSERTEDSGEAEPRSKRRERRRRRRISSTRHAIVITVPHTTFLTGKPVAGDTCQVPGVGPVPISVVHRLLDDDPIIKAIVTNGRDITAVATLTRSIKDDLHLAVLAANDRTCAVPRCTNNRFLELDHEWEYHKGGPTSYDNLRPLCCFHHRQRTREGYELRGSPGTYEWLAPDGTIISAEQSAVLV